MRAAGSFEFEVHVRPGSARAAIGGQHDGRLVVRVTEPARDGRANDGVQRGVAEAFSVSRHAVAIVSGPTSRRKRVRIEGDPDVLAARLHALCAA
ncbi:MAG: DUF167 domain-containing protein [Ilumatobacteraceae bacterium]